MKERRVETRSASRMSGNIRSEVKDESKGILGFRDGGELS